MGRNCGFAYNYNKIMLKWTQIFWRGFWADFSQTNQISFPRCEFWTHGQSLPMHTAGLGLGQQGSDHGGPPQGSRLSWGICTGTKVLMARELGLQTLLLVSDVTVSGLSFSFLLKAQWSLFMQAAISAGASPGRTAVCCSPPPDSETSPGEHLCSTDSMGDNEWEECLP